MSSIKKPTFTQKSIGDEADKYRSKKIIKCDNFNVEVHSAARGETFSSVHFHR